MNFCSDQLKKSLDNGPNSTQVALAMWDVEVDVVHLPQKVFSAVTLPAILVKKLVSIKSPYKTRTIATITS